MNRREKIMIIITIIALILVGWVSCNNFKLNKEYSKLSDENIENISKITEWQDKEGKLHARVQVLEINKEIYTSLYKKKMDSIANILKIKEKHIKDITIIASRTKGTFETKPQIEYVYDTIIKDGITRIDTVPYNKIDYKDNWLTFKGIYNKEKFTGLYEYKDSLSFITYIKRNGFLKLGKKKTYLDITSFNPNTRIINASKVELKDIKNKKFSVGPYVGCSYFNNKFQPNFGIGLQYNLISF